VSHERNGEKGDVLVVDDNRVNRLLVGRSLEQFGHRVAFAENGRRALQMLHDHPSDLVLLDIEMPEMNGYETLEALQADAKLRDIPVVMMSSVDEVGLAVLEAPHRYGDPEAPTTTNMVVHQAAGMVMGQLDSSIEEAMIRLRATVLAEGLTINKLAADVVNGRRRISKETQ
jgi:CheY-like chemotaxis protein